MRRRIPDKPKRQCRECIHAYDLQDTGADGRYIFCRCKLDPKSQFGKYCKFLSDVACEKFKDR